MVAPPAHLNDWYSENYTFVQGNILEQLPFAPMSFDFIHQRMLNFGIPRDKWQHVLQELLRVTRLGGWIELMEWGGYMLH